MRLAVIGLGNIGRRRLRLLREMGQDDVVVYDSDPRRCVEVAAEFECVACGGWREVWAYKPEVAFICTLPDSHATLAATFLSRGCHVFIEKPLETIIGHADWLVDQMARYPDRITMVACNWRFRAGVAELLAQPGPLTVRADVPIPVERRTELRWDIAWHFVDLALWTGHTYDVYAEYHEPYSVTMSIGKHKLTWSSTDGIDEMYRAEMAHFLDCAARGVPTCNPISQAAETLRVLLEVKGR